MSRLKVTFIGVALIFSIGLQWPLLQSVAWLNMIVTFSQENGVTQAFAMTFSGKHPCKLCKLVQAGQKAEKKDCQDFFLKKLDLFAENYLTVYWGYCEDNLSSQAVFPCTELHYPPLSPPPDRC